MRVEVTRTYIIEVPDTHYEDVVEDYLDAVADENLGEAEIPSTPTALAEDVALWMVFQYDGGDYTNFVHETNHETRVL